MIVKFPYDQVEPVEVPDHNLKGIFGLPAVTAPAPADALIKSAVTHPVASPPLRDLARGRHRALIVSDDISRPTPVHAVVPFLLRELEAAGIGPDATEFLMALGTHRFMTRDEMEQKLGKKIAARYKVSNHDWKNRDACRFMGTTAEGAEVWINRKVDDADLVIGVGRIMPIDVCGFTGGGKILVPGVCGDVTNSDMHWTRVPVPDDRVIGHRDNPIRRSIDAMARQAGLDFIVNLVVGRQGDIVGVVAGDMEAAHRAGCDVARRVHEVSLPGTADIVIADGYPFDIEFWQVNKALDTAGMAVRPGGVVIVVSPCYEGLAPTHPEILEFGYRSVAEIIDLVESGRLKDKVVGVHMQQVSRVAVERATVILVTSGISRGDVERVGLQYAPTPAEALRKAFTLMGANASVTVLRHAAEMLPRVGHEEQEHAQ